METNETINEAALTYARNVKSARLLFIIGFFILGLSYPLTVLFNSLGLNHTYPLYSTVVIGCTLIIWGMAKIF